MWAWVVSAIVVAFIFATASSKRNMPARSPGRSSAPTPSVKLAEIPRVVTALSATGKDRHFAVLLFGEAGAPPAERDALNAQISIDAGEMGIDWVLLADSNIAAAPRFVSFCERKGRTPRELTMNDVSSLRVEGDGLAELLTALLSEEFGVTAEQEMELMADGFEWKQSETDA